MSAADRIADELELPARLDMESEPDRCRRAMRLAAAAGAAAAFDGATTIVTLHRDAQRGIAATLEQQPHGMTYADVARRDAALIRAQMLDEIAAQIGAQRSTLDVRPATAGGDPASPEGA